MSDLTRRRFLKFVGLGTLATVVPVSKTVKAGPLTDRDRIPVEDVSIESRKVEFNPDFEYGRATEIRRLDDESVIQWLHQDAKKVLPKGTPYDIRLESTHRVHSNRETWEVVHIKRERRLVCWFYAPEFMGRKRGLHGTRLEDGPYNWTILRHSKPYVPPSGVTQDRWKWIPEFGVYMRGMFYA